MTMPSRPRGFGPLRPVLLGAMLSCMSLAGCGDDDGVAPPSQAAERSFSVLNSEAGQLRWVSGRQYRLTLAQPWQSVAIFNDRPFRTTNEESLPDWVGEWAEHGFAANPPYAAVSIAATGGAAAPDLVIAELSNPQITPAGLELDAQILDADGRSRALFPESSFGATHVFVDDERGTPDDRSTGVFVLSGTTGTLTTDGPTAYRLTIRRPADVVGFSQRPLRKAITESAPAWVREWAARGFDRDPPNAALTFSTDGTAQSTRSALVELTDPRFEDDAVQFRVRVLAQRAGEAGLPSGAVVDPQLFVDSAPLLSKSACRTDPDCGGSSTCDDGGVCHLRQCGSDHDCHPSESCDRGHCLVLTPCATGADCAPARVCDGQHCRLKPCFATADCDGTESCTENICMPGPAASPSLKVAAGPGALWGASWSTPRLTSTCSEQIAELQPFCQAFEQAGEDVVRNLVAMLSSAGTSYSYYGRFVFFGVNEQDPLIPPYRDQYAYPSAALQASLLQPFGVFDTAYMNYSTRLGPPLVNQEVLDPFSGPLPSTPLDFVTPQYDVLMNDTPDGFPDSFITSRDPLVLSKQFGGGGGFGCYIGGIASDGRTLMPPLVQFGGGFGFGISEADGLDIGFGGGINLCETASVQDCIEDPVNFFGSGAGINFDFTTSAEATDEDTDGNQSAFDRMLQSVAAPVLLKASELYVSCGSGGGVGFQSLPAAPGYSRIFQQTYGMGGGGYVFAIISRVADANVAGTNVLTGVDLDTYSDQLAQMSALLTGSGAAVEARPAPVAEVPDPETQRGLYTADGTPRYTGSVSNLGVVYEPYRFPITDPTTATADNAYVPGSTSPAQLFFSAWDSQTDTTIIKNSQIPRLLYTLNLNPVYVKYANDGTHEDFDINDSVLQALQATGATVTLAIPLFVQHDSDGTSQQAPLVSANQEVLDYALHAVETYANIDGIMVGTGAHSVIKGFSASCNDYNYSTPQLAKTCGGYADTLTFEDYYYLLDYLLTGIDRSSFITRTVTLGIQQTDVNWFASTSISNSDTDTKMRLVDYWSLPASTPNTGLQYFISSLSSPKVVLTPMFSIDLLTATYDGQPVTTVSMATAYLDSVLAKMQNVSTALVRTGWYGDDMGAFLSSASVTGIQERTGYALFVDELFDQPWRGLPADLPGMPGTTCGHVYPVPALDVQDPQGPPLPSQLPTECAPDFGNVAPGKQPQPPCLCLVNSTAYPATFFPFLSDVTTPADSGPNLTIPPVRVATYAKSPDDPNSFYNKAVANKDGAYALGAVWKQWPYSQTYDRTDIRDGDPVPAPVAGSLIPSLVCVGVSDAQNGAASANAGFPCDQVWFQSYASTVDSNQCVTVQWTAKGSGYKKVTGWELQTLEAPPPAPGGTVQTYTLAPLVVIPQQDQVFDDANLEVSSQYTYCGGSFPTGLDPGTYWFRVQPISGVPSVDGIDVEFDVVTVAKGTTDWQTLGKFTVDYPIGPDGTSVITSMVFTLPSQKSFTLLPPQDNGISDITLPGKPQSQSGGDDAPYVTTLTVNFDPPVPTSSGGSLSVCSVAMVISAGQDESDQNGEAVLQNGPIDPGKPEQACFLELQNDQKTINGASFQFTNLPK